MENEHFFNFWGSDWMVVIFVLIFIVLVANWRIFQKAGKQGWASIVPIYNTIVLLEIVGKPMWWFILIHFVPVANVIFGIWALNLLSKSFGKNAWFTVGIIFLPFVFLPILGFGLAEYQRPVGLKDQVQP